MTKIRHFPSALLFASTCALFALASLVHGFAQGPNYITNSIRPFRTILSAASAGNEPKGLGTLYDVLGASPTDSYQTIRQKYTALAKKMHPDTSPSDRLDVSEFTQVVAAWKVLQDPKERLKYDRSLKAKEFTDSMENLLDLSIQTAIPFMKKTADTTVAAVETSSAALDNVSQRMEKMSQQMSIQRELRDMERKMTSLQQQATREAQQAQKLKDELAVIDTKKLDKLADSNLQLTHADALRILDNFDVVQATRVVAMQEIQSLQKVDAQYKEKQKQRQATERATKNAEKSVENAIAREKLAIKRLEEAQREVKEAKRNIEQCQRTQKEAVSKEKTASTEEEKALTTLEKNTEKVRMSLRKKEGESLQRESTNSRKESARHDDAALQLNREAEKIRIQYNALKREQQQAKQK